DLELEAEVRKDVDDLAAAAPVGGGRPGGIGAARSPVRGRGSGHAAEQATGRTGLQEDPAAAVENDEGVAVTRWPYWLFRLCRKAQRVGPGGGAARLQGARPAKRNPWGAYGSTEIHQRLREVACPRRNGVLNRVADQRLGVP